MEKILHKYRDLDYIIQKRAEFIYYINIVSLFFVFIISVITAYLDIKNPSLGTPNINIQIIFVVLFIIYNLCLFLLYIGHLNVSANILLISTLLGIWLNMFIDNQGGIFQLDTIVYILVGLTLLPVVIGKNKLTILLYVLVNCIIFVVFSFFFKHQFSISNSEFRDYLTDTIVSMVLIGIISYNVFSIYRDALQRANNEIKERKEIELELKKHQENLELLVDKKTNDLQTLNEEFRTANEELNEKNNIISKNNNELIATLNNLKETQFKLIQNEKMVALGTLTSGVSHEINNPLNFIMGGFNGLEQYFKDFGSKDEETTTLLLESIKLGIERTGKIVRSLNDFSRDDDGYKEVCDIHQIIENCLLMLTGEISENIIVNKNFESNYAFIYGNIGKLHQVFINILNNALQAIDKDGEITIEEKINSDSMFLKFSDNGNGIKKEHLHQVFDPFFTTKDPNMGTGLGLSIAFTIVKEHNGDIEIVSEENRGTTVIVKLPVDTQ